MNDYKTISVKIPLDMYKEIMKKVAERMDRDPFSKCTLSQFTRDALKRALKESSKQKLKDTE